MTEEEFERSKAEVLAKLDRTRSERLSLCVYLAEFVRRHANDGDSVAVDLIAEYERLRVEEQLATIEGSTWLAEQLARE